MKYRRKPIVIDYFPLSTETASKMGLNTSDEWGLVNFQDGKQSVMTRSELARDYEEITRDRKKASAPVVVKPESNRRKGKEDTGADSNAA